MESRAAAPRVAVVVVNWNAGEWLARTLDALSRQTVAPARVLVVDNASTDGSADGLEERFPRVEVLRLAANVGFAAGNNVAIRAADDCEWIALLNPDALPEPGWLEALLRAARERPEFAFFGSRLLQADAPDRLDGTGDVYHVAGLAWRRGHGEPAAGRGLEPREIFSPCAAAALYRRDVVLAAGGLDERFFCYFEDTDLAFRLRLAGERCLYVPDAVVHHAGSVTAGVESDFTVYHGYRNAVWTYAKNMPGALAWLYLPQLLLVQLLLLTAFAVRRRPDVILRAQRDAVRGLPGMLRTRRSVQRSRVVSPWALRRLMARGLSGYLETFMHGFQRFFGAPRAAGAAAGRGRGAGGARHVITSGATQAWLLGLALVTTPFLVHGLGTEAYGVYALVLTLVGYFAFLDLGLGVATVRFVAQASARGELDAVERLVRTSAAVFLVLGLAGGLAVAGLASALVGLLDVSVGMRETAVAAIVVAGLGLAVNMPLAVFGAVPTALQRIDLANAITVCSATLGLGGAVVLVASGLGLVAVLGWSFAVTAASLVAFLVLARRLLPGVRFRPRVYRAELRELGRFGLVKFANQLSVQTVHHVDKLLVAALVSVSAVAFYAVPVAIAQRLTTLVGTVTVAFLPAATQLQAQRDGERFRELVFRAEKIVALALLPLAGLLVVFAEPILSLWLGTEFAERSAWPLRLLVAGYALSALGTVPAVACDAVGRPGVTTGFSLAGAVFNVSLCFVLIPRFGITGAGAVILCQSLVFLPAFIWFSSRRVLALSIGELVRRSLVRPVAAAGIAGAALVLVLPLVHGWPPLVAAFGLSLAVYAVAARAVGALDAVDRGAALRSLRRPAVDVRPADAP